MAKTLYNILVPVDFTSRNKWAITKAIELANAFNCNIHLVHVVSKQLLPFLPFDATSLFPYDATADMRNARAGLEELRDTYRHHLCGEGTIEISILQGPRRRQLATYISQYQMDMVVIGLARFNLMHRIWSSVSISQLARKTNIPVLAVRASGLVSHFKKIVLPLTDNIPVGRIKLATMLARSFKSTVYLVTLRNDHGAAQVILNKTLEVVQSISTIPVQCFMLEGKNVAQSTLEFSRRIDADLIMTDEVKDYNMPGFWNRITKKILSYGSSIPVITVDTKRENY